jgi:hypothetical protein
VLRRTIIISDDGPIRSPNFKSVGCAFLGAFQNALLITIFETIGCAFLVPILYITFNLDVAFLITIFETVGCAFLVPILYITFNLNVAFLITIFKTVGCAVLGAFIIPILYFYFNVGADFYVNFDTATVDNIPDSCTDIDTNVDTILFVAAVWRPWPQLIGASCP